MLKLNNDKTKLLLVYKNKHKNVLKNFKFHAGRDVITPKSSLKILGFILQNDLKTDKDIGKLAGQLHNRMNKIRTITKFTNFQTRLKFLNAFVIGKMNYMLPIYSLSDKTNIQKLHKILTTAGRTAIGSYCFKKSVSYILSKCKWLDIESMIYYSSINIIHKILIQKTPNSIYNLFRNPNNKRSVSEVTPNYIPTTKKYRKFYIYKYIKQYNELDSYIRLKEVKPFKKEMKEILM